MFHSSLTGQPRLLTVLALVIILLLGSALVAIRSSRATSSGGESPSGIQVKRNSLVAVVFHKQARYSSSTQQVMP